MQLQGIRLNIEVNSEMKHILNYTNLPPFETNSRIGCRTSRDSFYCITECPVRSHLKCFQSLFKSPTCISEQTNAGIDRFIPRALKKGGGGGGIKLKDNPTLFSHTIKVRNLRKQFFCLPHSFLLSFFQAHFTIH